MRQFLTKTQESKFNVFFLDSFWNHGAFHWVYINLNIKFEFFWNNKSREQILLSLIGQYGVEKYFFIRKFYEINLCEIITYRSLYIFKRSKINKIYFFFCKIYLRQPWNKCYTIKSRFQKLLTF